MDDHDQSKEECKLESTLSQLEKAPRIEIAMTEILPEGAKKDPGLNAKIVDLEPEVGTKKSLLTPWPWSSDAYKAIFFYCCFTLGRMGTNMFASGLTYAYINALVMLLQPFTVAVFEKAIFNQIFPKGLFPLLIFSVIGSACAGLFFS